MRVDLQSIAQAASFDPKKALLDRAGPLTDYEIFRNFVLVATYIAPETTAGGIIRVERSLQEDRFQGKVGLVLKMGPLAFKENDDAPPPLDIGGITVSPVRFGGVSVMPGDWVMYRPSDTIELFIKDWVSERADDGLSCRLIEDTLIKGRVRDPSLIY